MEEQLIIDPFKQVIKNRQPPYGMIVHSDFGSQYDSKKFRALIGKHHLRQSMTCPKDHYDNAYIESLFSKFKADILDKDPLMIYQMLILEFSSILKAITISSEHTLLLAIRI